MNNDNINKAIIMFNMKHRKCKVELNEMIDGCLYFKIKNIDNKYCVYIRNDITMNIGDIEQILEDLRKDLTGAKK